MAESLVGWQWQDRVCVAVFDPPDAVQQFERWKTLHAADFGPLDDWIVNFGRHATGRDFASVWVLRQHLPRGFPISDNRLGR